jgi:eukaryotic-like serine/threonine-protein kinase
MPDNKITQIGKYHVIKTIGRGGMGVVYKATDPQLGRMVAIKMMSGDGVFANDPDLLKRFYREAKFTASLRHPNIVTVHDVGDQEGRPYLVMEFLDGDSLDAIINSQRDLSLLEKTNCIIQVCRGLEYAHERNIIHRDIKPANIMVLRDGLSKIVDFGIARMGDDHVTRPGQVMGSIHYLSPEQVIDRDVDTRTDLFATGTVLYELLTYNLPFKGEDVRGTLFKIVHDPPPPLSLYLKSYPPDLDAIIARALAKDSKERYQTADEMAFDLTQVQLQLKAGLVAELLEKANTSIKRGELTNAKDYLLGLRKLDPQNKSANELMLALQKAMQERRQAEQVQQFRKEAEEAAKRQQFDMALRLIEQAITVDHTNPELVSIRDDLNRAKVHADFVRDCMNRAQSSRNSNDLDRALEYLDQLLGREPRHASAVALRDQVIGEIAHREKQRQVQELMEKTQSLIASRQFASALEVLDQVSELDPNISNLRGLVRLVNKGIEQERCRQLQILAFEIERLLECDDYLAALAQIENGLHIFPDEPILLTLKGISEQHREVAEHRKKVNVQVAAARNLLNSGKAEEAIAALQSASNLIDRVPLDVQSRCDDLKAIISQCLKEAEANRLRSAVETTGAGACGTRQELTSRLLPTLGDATTQGMGEGSSMPALGPTSNDKTLLELTPPEGQILPAAGPEPLGNVSRFRAETLVRAEKQLATFLVPLAKILVKKAATKANNSDELYALLATNLERESDRKAFLAGNAESIQDRTTSRSVPEPALTKTVSPISQIGPTRADVDSAARLLARYLGPIANVLAERAAKRAGNSLSTLYSLLSEHLENNTERARFLRDSGFFDP